MKVLFIARHFTYFRNFDSAIESLAALGHEVHLAADRDETRGGRDLVDRIAARLPRVTVGVTPIHEFGRYTRVARALRLGLDYLRYSDPRFASMPEIRQRAYDRTPAFVLALARLPFRRALAWVLARIEEAVPRQKGVDTFIGAQRPDLLLITPLIELGSPQLDYVRAARRLGVRSALCVWSWDHLSSKSLMRVPPDAVIVWNDTQKAEAALFHGVEPERVIVTGAQCFDRWFGRQPSRSRAEFCRRAGLPDDRPFILYVCSALFRGSPSEAAFVRDWVRAVRSSSEPTLAGTNILVRPHPQRMDQWRREHCSMPNAQGSMPNAQGSMETAPSLGIGASALGTEHSRVAIWGSNPIDDEGRSDYFDSLYYSAAVVGLNTSALVEAAIVDRPVFTLLLPAFHDNQEGTFHFHHLMTVGDGFLNVARSLPEHVRQLAALAHGAVAKANRPFVECFIRPRGVNVAATPVFVETVEQLASAPKPAPQPAPAWVFLLRPAVYALVLAGRVPFLKRLYWNRAKFQQLANA